MHDCATVRTFHWITSRCCCCCCTSSIFYDVFANSATFAIEKETNRTVCGAAADTMIFEIFAEQNLISRESTRLPYTVASTTHTQTRVHVCSSVCSSGQRNANNEHLCRIYDSSECWCVCVCARSSSRLNASVRSLLRCYLMPHYVHTHSTFSTYIRSLCYRQAIALFSVTFFVAAAAADCRRRSDNNIRYCMVHDTGTSTLSYGEWVAIATTYFILHLAVVWLSRTETNTNNSFLFFSCIPFKCDRAAVRLCIFFTPPIVTLVKEMAASECVCVCVLRWRVRLCVCLRSIEPKIGNQFIEFICFSSWDNKTFAEFSVFRHLLLFFICNSLCASHYIDEQSIAWKKTNNK